MLIALDTATEWCSVGVASTDLSDMLIVSRKVGCGHSAYLVPMLDDLLLQRKMSFSAVTGIVITVGPGSFTGLRIACGVAHGLALNQNLPIVALSTLEVIAQRYSAQTLPTVVCLDARMGELYCAVFDSDGFRLVEDFVARPDAVSARVIAELGTNRFNAAGNGWAIVTTQKTAMFQAINQRDEYAYPQAADLLRLGALQLVTENRSDGNSVQSGARNNRWLAKDALPLYVRNDVALDLAAQRQLRDANDQSKSQNQLNLQTTKALLQ